MRIRTAHISEVNKDRFNIADPLSWKKERRYKSSVIGLLGVRMERAIHSIHKPVLLYAKYAGIFNQIQDCQYW